MITRNFDATEIWCLLSTKFDGASIYWKHIAVSVLGCRRVTL